MSAWLRSIIAAAPLLIGAPDLPRQMPRDPAPPLELADGAGPSWARGDSRRPRVEVPSNAPPAAREVQPTPAEGVSPTPQGGERATGTKGLGKHRPGELYLPGGEHRPGDLDNQGRYRPGDLG